MPAGRPGPTRSGQLPAQPTSIVGRSHEIDAACAEIVERGARLVTLSGPPGVGKTRLAVEIADGLAERFEHGAWFVDLAPVADAHHVAATL
jgi:MoxR-like ATPase